MQTSKAGKTQFSSPVVPSPAGNVWCYVVRLSAHPSVTIHELLIWLISSELLRSNGGVVVKLIACKARGSNLHLTTRSSEIGYLLLPSCNMTEIMLKQRKSSKQPTQPSEVLYT